MHAALGAVAVKEFMVGDDDSFCGDPFETSVKDADGEIDVVEDIWRVRGDQVAKALSLTVVIADDDCLFFTSDGCKLADQISDATFKTGEGRDLEVETVFIA